MGLHMGCGDAHRFNDGANWPSRRWDITKRREHKFLSAHNFLNSASPLAEISDPEFSFYVDTDWIKFRGLSPPRTGDMAIWSWHLHNFFRRLNQSCCGALFVPKREGQCHWKVYWLFQVSELALLVLGPGSAPGKSKTPLKSTPTYLSNRWSDLEIQVTLGHLHLTQIAMHTSNVSLLRVLFEIEAHEWSDEMAPCLY